MRYNKDGTISEHVIQATIVEWLSWQPNILFYSIPNENFGNRFHGKKLNDRGRKKGVSDLFIAEARRGFHGMYLEVKSQNGKLQIAQKEFFKKAEERDYFTSAVWSAEEGIEILSWYLQLKVK
jgi:hypothetical protein